MSAKPNRAARRWLLLIAAGMQREAPSPRHRERFWINGKLLHAAFRHRSFPGLKPMTNVDAYWVSP